MDITNLQNDYNCEKKMTENNNMMVLELSIHNDEAKFDSQIREAIEQVNIEVEELKETIESVKKLVPECDKIDYMLAASSGALCGMIDIFLVGKPGESKLEDYMDKWVENRVMDFARLCGWKDKNGKGIRSAIGWLERKFKVPYDQRGAGDAGKVVFGLNPQNHHFKSLAHNPTLFGLFFSILNQFQNTSSFVSGDEMITLTDASDKFELKGDSVVGKIFCGFVNWFGHIMSDIAGHSGSADRGAGIPSPLWAWTNDVIAIKRSLGITDSDFGKSINELALKIYEKGFDARFQLTQFIPVIVNELIVRFMYAIRRLIKYYNEVDEEERSFKLMWQFCEPFSNYTVKRMLMVAHGVFCAIDIGDAVCNGFREGGGEFNPVEFCLRLNIAGVVRFTISLYGEGVRLVKYLDAKEKAEYAKKKKIIVDNYLAGLRIIAKQYDDNVLVMSFIDEFLKSNMYREAFEKTAELAEMRNVPTEKILRTKSDIDMYFKGGN